MQALALQPAKAIISIACQRHLLLVQRMLHLCQPVGMVVSVGIYFREGVFPRSRVGVCHRLRYAAEGVRGACHVIPVKQITLLCTVFTTLPRMS